MVPYQTHSWRDPHREIDAACAILDLLPRHVAHRVELDVFLMSCGQLCAVAAMKAARSSSEPTRGEAVAQRQIGRRTDYAQGMLPDAEFPVFAARHIAAFAAARVARAA